MFGLGHIYLIEFDRKCLTTTIRIHFRHFFLVCNVYGLVQSMLNIIYLNNVDEKKSMPLLGRSMLTTLSRNSRQSSLPSLFSPFILSHTFSILLHYYSIENTKKKKQYSASPHSFTFLHVFFFVFSPRSMLSGMICRDFHWSYGLGG